jgi:hypothetical protein
MWLADCGEPGYGGSANSNGGLWLYQNLASVWTMTSYFEPPAGEIGFRSVTQGSWNGAFVLYLLGEPLATGASTSTTLYRFLPTTQSFAVVPRAGGVVTNAWYKGIAAAPFTAAGSPSRSPSATSSPQPTPTQTGTGGSVTPTSSPISPVDANNILVCPLSYER